MILCTKSKKALIIPSVPEILVLVWKRPVRREPVPCGPTNRKSAPRGPTNRKLDEEDPASGRPFHFLSGKAFPSLFQFQILAHKKREEERAKEAKEKLFYLKIWKSNKNIKLKMASRRKISEPASNMDAYQEAVTIRLEHFPLSNLNLNSNLGVRENFCFVF